jgi:hypothetical protein
MVLELEGDPEEPLDPLADTVIVVEEMTMTELITLVDMPAPEPDKVTKEERVLEVGRAVEPEPLVEALIEVDEGVEERVNVLVVKLLTKVVLLTNTPLLKLMLDVTLGRQLDGIVEQQGRA